MDNNDKVVRKFRQILKYIDRLDSVKATVGVHADKGQDNVNKAVWNEFGTKHISKGYKFIKNGVEYKIKRGTDISIPARPFIRLYLYPKDVAKIREQFAKSVQKVLFTKAKNDYPLQLAKRTMGEIGRVARKIMKDKIRKIRTFQKNAPLTQEIKGFNHPLYETGELLNSIDSKTERR